MFATKYDDVLEVTGNELEQINYILPYFTPYFHLPSFDTIKRKGMCRNYCGKQSEQNKHVRVCTICDEVRCHIWRVRLNILLEYIPGHYLLEY